MLREEKKSAVLCLVRTSSGSYCVISRESVGRGGSRGRVLGMKCVTMPSKRLKLVKLSCTIGGERPVSGQIVSGSGVQ